MQQRRLQQLSALSKYVSGYLHATDHEVFRACSLHFVHAIPQLRVTTFDRPLRLRCKNEDHFRFVLRSFAAEELNDETERVLPEDIPVKKTRGLSRDAWPTTGS